MIDLKIDWQEYRTTFRGQEITMEIRPLKRWANALLTEIYLTAAKEKIDKKKKRELTQKDIDFAYKMQELGSKIFPDHLRNLSGIKVNGEDITIGILCEESVFSFLAMSILSQMANITAITGNDVKN